LPRRAPDAEQAGADGRDHPRGQAQGRQRRRPEMAAGIPRRLRAEHSRRAGHPGGGPRRLRGAGNLLHRQGRRHSPQVRRRHRRKGLARTTGAAVSATARRGREPMRTTLLASVLGLALWGSAQAAIDTYEFGSDSERARFRQLTEELRCPKCQNQNIADSNAPIATDLRREIFRMLEEGKSDDEIVDYLVDRYGDFVRYKPPVNARTLLLW